MNSHKESCDVCDRVGQLEKALRLIDAHIEDAMSEPLVGGRALLSLRFARQIIESALHG